MYKELSSKCVYISSLGSDSAPGSYFCIYSDRGVIEITDSFRWLDNEQFNITIEVLGENGASVSQSIKLNSKDICRDISPLYTQAELKCSPGPLHEFRADDDDLVTHVVAHRVKEIMKAVINESTNILRPRVVSVSIKSMISLCFYLQKILDCSSVHVLVHISVLVPV